MLTLIKESKKESCLDSSQTPVIRLDEEDLETINEVTEFLYTGGCTSLPVCDSKVSNQVRQLTDEDILDALAMSLQDVDFDIFSTGEICCILVQVRFT